MKSRTETSSNKHATDYDTIIEVIKCYVYSGSPQIGVIVMESFELSISAYQFVSIFYLGICVFGLFTRGYFHLST